MRRARARVATVSVLSAMLSFGASATADRAPPETALENARRLARMLNETRTLLGLAKGRALAPDCTEAELLNIVSLYERLGEPDQGVRVLEARVEKFPRDLYPRVELARLHERAGTSVAALPVWAEIEKQYGLTALHAIEYARALDRHGKATEALAMLSRVAPKAKDDDEPFFLAYATLAWNLDDPEAIVPFRKLWKMKSKAQNVSWRLTSLAIEKGETAEAVAVALEAYAIEKVPSHLFTAAALLAKIGDHDAVKRTVDIADKDPALFAPLEDYWVLRGDTYAQLGQKDVAREAFRKAIEINPASVPARVSLMWDAIERGDLATLSLWIARWKGDAGGDPAFSGPFAVALDRLGRTHEALPYYAKHMQLNPKEYLWVLEYGDALERVGHQHAAFRLRRHALAGLRRDLVAGVGKDDQKLLATHALLTKREYGIVEGEPWLAKIVRKDTSSIDARELAIDWYLAEGRVALARRWLQRSHEKRIDRPPWKSFRLEVAMADGDRITIGDILASPAGLTEEQILHASVAIHRDDLAASSLSRSIELRDTDDTRPLRDSLRDIAERHRPHASLGAAYDFVDGLVVLGPEAMVSHDDGRYRVAYAAAGRRLWVPNVPLSPLAPRIETPVLEVDAAVYVRRFTEASATEGGVGVSYQASAPAPRLTFLDVRSLGRDWSSSLKVRLDDLIEDTPFLRVAALRDKAVGAVRVDLPGRVYAFGELTALEDHSRKVGYLGAEVGGLVDLGYRLHIRDPEWTLAVRGVAYQRWNPSSLPDDVAKFVPRRSDPTDVLDVRGFLPPSYQLVSLTTQLAKGDFVQQHKTDDAAFPRYDCDGAVGYLTVTRAVAAHGKCAASVRLPSGGFITASAFYAFGAFGRTNAVNAQYTLSYTHVLY